MIEETADVLVIGGGTAGAIAAIQSARAGADTILVEMGPQLGGTMTTGLVSAPAYFFSRDRQIIAGIGWELATAAIALSGGKLPDFSRPNPRRPSYHVSVDPFAYALLAEEACRDAGVRLRYHEVAVGITPEDGGWSVRTAGKNIRRSIGAREVIDATGDADTIAMLGLERVRGGERQPGTLLFRLGGYDPSALDREVVERRYREALRDGALQPGDFCYADRPFHDFLRSGGSNMQHIDGADSSTAASQTAASVAGRESLLRILRFVRSLPGCEGARIERMAAMAATRETWRIVGETTISDTDYLGGRRFDDAICYSLYFIDVHHSRGTHHEFLPDGVVPTIPLGALIPRGSRRLLVAGRCLSCDQRAFSALRVEASCMAMGQAAGAAAALGAGQNIPSRDVPLEDIRSLLREHGAIVP